MAVKNHESTPGPPVRYWGYKWHGDGNIARIKPRILVAAIGFVLLALMAFVPSGIVCCILAAGGHWLIAGGTFAILIYLFIVIGGRFAPEYSDQIPVTVDLAKRQITFSAHEPAELTSSQISSIGVRTISTISFREPTRAFDVVVNCWTPTCEAILIARFADAASARRVARQAAAMLETSYREEG